MRGTKYEDNSDVIQAANAIFEAQPKSFYKTGIESLQEKWA